MGRSTKKGPFVEEKLLKKVYKQKESGDKELFLCIMVKVSQRSLSWKILLVIN